MKIHQIWPRFLTLSVTLVLCLSFAGCSDETPAAKQIKREPLTPAETVAGTGHRVFFNEAGKTVQLNQHTLLQNQRKLAEIWGAITATHLPPAQEIEFNFRALDEALALASAERKPGAVSAQQVNTALYHFFRSELRHGKNVRRSALATTNSGQAYITECADAGVPIPDLVMDPSSGWVLHGKLTTDFITPGADWTSELWSWQGPASEPAGICVALPRWRNNNAEALGLICMGEASGKVCYWDNPSGQFVAKDTTDPQEYRIPIQWFIGGYKLESNGGGICSDCHAGSNPFIIHPDDPVFGDFDTLRDLTPARWPDPIVHPAWPQNPGPLVNIPRPSPGQDSCTRCHASGSNSFPLLSTDLKEYCLTVLEGTLNAPTMPRNGDASDFTDQITYLRNLCNAPPPNQGTINDDPPGNDPSYLSPPIIIEPLFECANTVGVEGARSGATIILLADGQTVDSKVVTNPNLTEFDLGPVRIGDLTPPLTAVQIYGNYDSLPSREVYPKDHLMVYPNGLPAPSIDPRTVYECASNIAVRHVPGATLRVTTNYNNPIERTGSSTGYSLMPGDGPFTINDRIEVEQAFCNDWNNGAGPDSVDVIAAPVTMPAVRVKPYYEGQRHLSLTSIVEGSTINIYENVLGQVSQLFSWPVRVYNEYDIATHLGRSIAQGDELWAEQELCGPAPVEPPGAAIPCDELGPPKISPPMEGDQDLVISGAATGAGIRVYDSGGAELGDGGGSRIALARALVGGETITVVQDLEPTCSGQVGVDVVVRFVP